ncbi:helix-turn-helix domain-containing protein, partial [Glaesserella parasuis]|uniref:helix-turn-helix domain-containing protein n=1 Tax=Glaesserella parasuis TaxID=738 RepID=UPI003B80089B
RNAYIAWHRGVNVGPAALSVGGVEAACASPKRVIGLRGAARPGVLAVDWDKIRIFLNVAEAGSFTKAGDDIGLSQSAVSRQISALERELKAP